MKWTCDFETTTLIEDCRVWAWGLCEIDNTENFKWGKDIDSLMDLMHDGENHILYFHNLKFDGEFILYWLFQNGFIHVQDKKDKTTKTFSTLISDKAQFYSIEICFKKQGKHTQKLTIYDSLKIIPFPVDKVAKAFNLPISKLKIDYEKIRPIGYEPNEEEREYLKNDVSIMAMALSILFKQNLTKMTQGSNALFDFKNTISNKKFEKWFPSPSYDADIRQSYKGGYTYINPKIKGKNLKDGLVFDVNSLYPSVMYYKPLPYGEGIFFEGKYKYDNLYFLYVQMLKCQFKLKENYLPTIQLKNNLSFMPNEYLEDSGEDEVTLCLTSVDLELFFEHYNVYNEEYLSGWKFKGTTGLFSTYIDKWSSIKIKSKNEKNEGMYTLAKLMLNALYGKFALNPNVQSKYPYFQDGLVKYALGKKETRNPIYIPVGTFITAWSRYITISSAQKVYDRFWYSDTDSLHISGTDIPKSLEISDTKLGAWKHEKIIKKARFLRQKCYIEYAKEPTQEKFEWKITCAGMPKTCYQYVNWNNFKIGNKFAGKLQQKRVHGGIVLLPIDFTIKS